MTQFQQYINVIVIGIAVVAVAGVVLGWISSGIRNTLNTAGHVVGWVGVALMALNPWIVHLIGGYQGKSLEQPVQSMFTMPESTLWGLIVMGAAGVGLALITGFAAWISTRVSTILLNIIGNFLTTMWISLNTAKQYGAGKLVYYQLYAAEIAVVTTIIVIIMGVFGAWNKNPTQVERGAA